METLLLENTFSDLAFSPQERTLEIRTFLEHFHQWDDGDSKEEERRRHITVTECCVHSLSVVRMDVCSVRRAPLSFEVTLETAAIWAGRGVSVTE